MASTQSTPFSSRAIDILWPLHAAAAPSRSSPKTCMATGVALAVGGCRAASAICTPATLARDETYQSAPPVVDAYSAAEATSREPTDVPTAPLGLGPTLWSPAGQSDGSGYTRQRARACDRRICIAPLGHLRDATALVTAQSGRPSVPPLTIARRAVADRTIELATTRCCGGPAVALSQRHSVRGCCPDR